MIGYIMAAGIFKTKVHNRTNNVLQVFTQFIRLNSITPGAMIRLTVDINETYREHWSVRPSGSRTIIVSSDDCEDWESINVVPRRDDTTIFEWIGVERRKSPQREAVLAAWDGAWFSVNMEEDVKRVVIYRAQCANLVQFCSERLQRIKKIFSLLSHRQMGRFRSRKLQQLAKSLDNLLRALLSAQMLLKGCGKKEWRRAALVLSLPPPDPQNLEKHSGSKFFLVIRELGWSFDMVQYALDEEGTREFKWDDGRYRYVLQGNQPEDGVANDAMELLRGDADRESRDHKQLLSDLEKGPLLKDNFYIPLAEWFWDNFFISLAGWYWYIFFISLAGWFWDNFFISLAGWLWYTDPFGSSAATIQNWCSAGWPWYNSSHQKFAETIQNRCRKPDSDIDDLDLRKKKRIGKGGCKEVHKGKWLGLEVAIATFKPSDSTSRSECEGILKELRKEVEFMVILHHPNVVDFFGYAIEKDQRTAFLVMELMEEDLGHLIERNMKLQQSRRSDFGGVFSLSVTVEILMQIVEAMIHSHKHQVMHRDLKPGNCLVSKKAPPRRSHMDVHYTVKVIDFGNSRLWDSESGNNTYPSGTNHYMAPEARDSGDYTYSVDIYSFGMLCFEVITGFKPLESRPFYPWSVKESFAQLRRGERPIIPANCPGSLSTLMRKCWAATPTDRPTFKAIQRDLWDYRLLLEAQYVP